MTASNPLPGWYPDPAGTGGVRYWDGGAWTPHVRSPGLPPSVPPASPTPGAPPVPPRRPDGWQTWAALLLVGALVLVLAWQLVGAIRQPGARTPPPAPPTAPAASAPPTGPAASAPVPSLPSPGTPPSLPDPTLTMDTGCPGAGVGQLRTRLASLTLPSGWEASEPFLSFDCSTGAVADRVGAFADVALGSVDPQWGLDDDEIIDWAWDDLGIAAPLVREVRTLGVVGSRPAVLVTRVLAERIEGVDHTTEVRIGVIDAGSEGQEVVVTALSVEAGGNDPALVAQVEAIWRGVRIGG